jgi:hypothetical protein
VMYLGNKRAKTHMVQVLINSPRYKWALAIGLGEGRGSTWSFETHHVDGGVWNAWLSMCL